MNITITTPYTEIKAFPAFTKEQEARVVIPGDVIETEQGFIKGHGIHEEGGKLIANYCGIVLKLNRLIYVSPLNSRYVGQAGDVIIGRVDEISTGTWLLDIGSSKRGQLSIHSINLPGSVQRKRLDEDYLEMRKYFVEGDVVCCEVQRSQDNTVILHTRTARYGQLVNGCLVRVAAPLVQRQSKHIVTLQCGVQVILGNNGFVWISHPAKVSHEDTLNYAVNQMRYELVEPETRRKISRVRNCIVALGSAFFSITPDSIYNLYDRSIKASLSALDLLKKDVVDPLLELLYVEQIKSKD